MKHWWIIPCAALLLAPTANAQPYDPDHDIQYVREINQAGIRYDTRENLIAMGHTICDTLTRGASYSDLITVIERDTATQPYLANVLASKAVENMCPSQYYKVMLAQIEFAPKDRIQI
jgi:hypothetical protein